MNTQEELDAIVALLKSLSVHPDTAIDTLDPARKAEIEKLLGASFVTAGTLVLTVAAELDRRFKELQNTLVDEVATLKEQFEEASNRIATHNKIADFGKRITGLLPR